MSSVHDKLLVISAIAVWIDSWSLAPGTGAAGDAGVADATMMDMTKSAALRSLVKWLEGSGEMYINDKAQTAEKNCNNLCIMYYSICLCRMPLCVGFTIPRTHVPSVQTKSTKKKSIISMNQHLNN